MGCSYGTILTYSGEFVMKKIMLVGAVGLIVVIFTLMMVPRSDLFYLVTVQRSDLFYLYSFGKDITNDDVIAAMDKDGKRPATKRELLAFVKANPETRGQFSIIVSKSIWVCRHGSQPAAYLREFDSFRDLSMYYHDLGLYGNCRFLAVDK